MALWFCTKRSPAVVWCDSENAPKLVAASWADFLASLSGKKTGVPDLDDREIKSFPSIRGVPKKSASLTAKRRLFSRWLNEHTAVQERPNAAPSEKIRREIYYHFKPIIEKEDLYRIDLEVTLTSRTYCVLWANYGMKPYPKSKSKRLRPILEQLANLVGRSLKKSNVIIDNEGRVFVDGGFCLGNPKLYKL